MSRTILVVGAGRIGFALARLLSDAGHDVVLVERDPERAQTVGETGARVVTADGTDPASLEAAGIHAADVVAAVTGDDAANLVVTALARFEFRVPRTIARIVDPAHAWLFDEAAGVDVAVDQADLLTRIIVEEVSLGEVATLVKLRRGDFSLIEEQVAVGSQADGRPIAALGLSPACVLVGVLRDEAVLAAHGGLVLRGGDEVLAVVHAEAAGELARVLTAL